MGALHKSVTFKGDFIHYTVETKFPNYRYGKPGYFDIFFWHSNGVHGQILFSHPWNVIRMCDHYSSIIFLLHFFYSDLELIDRIYRH